MLKRIIALCMAVMLLTVSVPAMAETPKVKKTEYEGSGYVEVDFKKSVQYKNAKVRVKDANGKEYSVSIREKDSDDITFKVSGVEAGKTYAYQISGIRSGKKGSYVAITGKFTVPDPNKVTIKEVDYDKGDKELEVEFKNKVKYKNLKVTVKNSSGKKFTTKILDKESDGLELSVKGLTYGKKYTITVSGVSSGKTADYTTVSKTFTAK